jgi:hypothetical protein
MNRFQGYEKTIPSVMEELGYNSEWSDARSSNSFLAKALLRAGISQRIRSVSRKNVDRIVGDARRLSADTILLVSPENLRRREIEWLREDLPGIKIVLYIYDSSTNRYLDQAMIDGVDVAYSFDLNDCRDYSNLWFLPLPHHHDEFAQPTESQEFTMYDFCFIGTARVRRLRVLSDIAKKAGSDNKSCYFYLYAPSLLQYLLLKSVGRACGYEGFLSRESIPFETYLDTLRQSSCVVDIEQTNQGGLTIRTMDTVFGGRPLATSNANVAHHDFFDHFPITIFSADDADVEVPKVCYSSQADLYFAKYHISNWLRTMMLGQVDDYLSHSEESTLETSPPC